MEKKVAMTALQIQNVSELIFNLSVFLFVCVFMFFLNNNLFKCKKKINEIKKNNEKKNKSKNLE